MSRWTVLKTLGALGPQSVARVGAYRLGLRSGRHPVQRISAVAPSMPLFAAPTIRAGLPTANTRWSDRLWWFDWFSAEHAGEAPDWHYSPFGSGPADKASNWWAIPDFAGSGDIKGVWELSRFGWSVAFATQAAHGDVEALATLNCWLQSWLRDNPPYRGANWKCGQEASFRVIHLLATAIILGQERTPEPALAETIALHLERIAPTMSYAIGQDNNHGTSEAAAMFVGGSFLSALGWPKARHWTATGRRWLENRARHLIAPDGSFSQYSVVYHRLMLDTYSFVEMWRQRWDLAPFSGTMHTRLMAGTRWLDAMVDRTSGDAPNLGANDGARLLPLTESDYRDFRPSLQMASVLFRGQRAIGDHGPWDDQLRWLGISPDTTTLSRPASETFNDGGFHVLRTGRASAYLRYPRFRFRPSQADLLHMDLWVDGLNLLRDAGTFSYNAEPETSGYFAGTASHNTVQFDGRDQMPRLGRFLFGAWPKARRVVFVSNGETLRCAAAYTDHRGARHHREILLRSHGFTCTDTIDGRFDAAVLRWRLLPDAYRLENHRLSSNKMRLSINCNDSDIRISLTNACESRYYMHREQIQTLEIAFNHSCKIVTTGEF